MFLVLENDFFLIIKVKYFSFFNSIFFLEISAINHKKLKKRTN